MNDESSAPAAASERSSALRPWVLRILKLAVTLGAFAFVAQRVDPSQLRDSFSRIGLVAALASATWFVANSVLAAYRMRLLLSVFGAARVPPASTLLRLDLIGTFYNTYLPGAVAGDVVRSLTLRSAFANGGATAGFSIVFVERVLGFLGLFLLVSGATLLAPIVAVPGLSWVAAAGVLLASCCVLALANLHRVAPILPARLAELVRAIPRPRSFAPFGLAVAISVLAHASIAFAGHGLLADLDTPATFSDSMVIIPVAAASVFIPVTVAGAGVREAVLVELYGRLHVAPSDALVVSLGLWASQLLVGALGGVLALRTVEPR
jgi:glycosyltransferase 2 family protein